MTQHWDREKENADGSQKKPDEFFEDTEKISVIDLSAEEEAKRWMSEVEDGTCWKCRGSTAKDCLRWGRKVDCYDHQVEFFYSL